MSVRDSCSSWVEDLARSGAMRCVCSSIAVCLPMKGVSEESAASCGCSGVIESVGVGLVDHRLRRHVWLSGHDEGTAKTTTTTPTITTITTVLKAFNDAATIYQVTAMPS